MTRAQRGFVGLIAALTLGLTGFARAQDVLRVGTDATFPPFEYTENGKRVGFDVELIEAIAKVLNKKVEWTDIDFKGFAHSHPGAFDRLSVGDMIYIQRLLEKNPDIAVFPAPIVIPHEFRLRAIVVLRHQPNVQFPTTFELF